MNGSVDFVRIEPSAQSEIFIGLLSGLIGLGVSAFAYKTIKYIRDKTVQEINQLLTETYDMKRKEQ